MTSDLQEKQKLGLSDLALVMDNYQNILQMDTIILEQQKQVIELQKQLVQKHDDLSTKQTNVCLSLDRILEKLDTYTNRIVTMESGLTHSCSGIEDNIGNKLDKISNDQTSHRLEDVETHNKITNKIYLGMVATGGAIVSLVTLLIIVYDKYEILQNAITMLKQMLIYFNIS